METPRMDGNKDESEHCIELAEHYINEGNRTTALKYLYKAEKLYPSQRAKDLIELLQKLNGTTGFENPKASGSERNGTSNIRNRSSSQSRTNSGSKASESEEKEYTKEQLEAVQRIKRCKDYYEILGVTKDSCDSDIKKQYKKLALQFHPDKNKAPGASEAFKAIGNAFSVLNDPEKRKQYDMYGTEEARRQHHAAHAGSSGEYYDYTRGFEGDISAEELFNMFFGGGFGPGMTRNVYVRRGNRWHQQRQQADVRHESGYSVLLQMMPILVLVSLSLMSSFFVSEPAYSLSRNTKYHVERRTNNLDVPYYVKENFETEYAGSIRRVEAQVEEDHLSNLRISCIRERNYKESMVWRARSYRDKELEEKANTIRTPSCDTLQKLSRRIITAW